MKIFVLPLLLIAAVFGLMPLTGCDEGMQMMKPIMEKPMPPEMKPEPPITEVPEPEIPAEPKPPIGVVPEPLKPELPTVELPVEPDQPRVEFPAKLPEKVTDPYPEEEAYNMALQIARDTIGLMEITEGVSQYRFGETISEEAEKVLIEGTGLTWEQLRSYTYECLEESGGAEHVEVDSGVIAYIDVLVNYLELFLLYPNNGDHEFTRLMLMNRCREGKVAVEVIEVIEKYYFPDHVDDLLEDWEAFPLGDPEEPPAGGEDAAGEGG